MDSKQNNTTIRWAVIIFVVFIILSISTIIISYFVFKQLYDTASDPMFTYNIDKTINASVDTWMNVEAKINQVLSARLSKTLDVELPINEKISVLINDSFTVPIDQSFTIPIKQNIFVEADIPVDINVPLEGINIQTKVFGIKKVTIPLKGSFPLKTVIPIRIPIHVQANAKIHLKQEVTTHLKKNISLPLKINVNTKIPIDDMFNIRLPDKIKCSVRVLDKNIPANVHLRLGLSKKGKVIIE